MEKRFEEHISKKDLSAFTGRASDWILYFRIDELEYNQARKIEFHIKKMKSKKFIEDLKRYPEMVQKLLAKYL